MTILLLFAVVKRLAPLCFCALVRAIFSLPLKQPEINIEVLIAEKDRSHLTLDVRTRWFDQLILQIYLLSVQAALILVLEEETLNRQTRGIIVANVFALLWRLICDVVTVVVCAPRQKDHFSCVLIEIQLPVQYGQAANTSDFVIQIIEINFKLIVFIYFWHIGN